MLLDAGSDPYVFDMRGRSPLVYESLAPEAQALEGVEFFLKQDIPVPCEDCSCEDRDDHAATKKWRAAIARLFDVAPAVSKLLVQGLKTRREKLRQMAQQVLPAGHLAALGMLADVVPDIHAGDICAALSRFGVEIPRALYSPPLRTTLYHGIAFGRPASPVSHLDLVYEMGFRDLDAVNHSGLTPLAEIAIMRPLKWRSSTDKVFYDIQDTRSDLDIALWLICKGADMTLSTSHQRLCRSWTVPVNLAHRVGIDMGNTLMTKPPSECLTEESHWVALKLMTSRTRSRSKRLNDDGVSRLKMLLTLLQSLLALAIKDDCLCACSEGGCSSLPALLIGFAQNFAMNQIYDQVCENRTSFNLAWAIAEFISLLRAMPRLSETINQSPQWCMTTIRFWTFERLELTHICCRDEKRWGSYDVDAHHLVDPAEAREIQEEEIYGLARLEELVKEFQTKRQDLALSVEDFLEVHWDRRMMEVLAEQNFPDDCHRKAVSEIGVKLH
ncbi:MAG: hypothetical protein M1821_003350 [Bathelium mastoideum]|nr:MAG: hypothetical protein M1821_003350 [Bathelium mastoideum]